MSNITDNLMDLSTNLTLIDDYDFSSAHDSMPSLTDGQDKALFLLPLISGLLSAWGSSNIISMYFRTQDRNCYKRIMLGLSCTDLISSLTLALQPFLLPSDSHRIWASGNETTCVTMGFLQQFAFSAMFYNGMLSFFFLLSIRYGIEEEKLAKYYEPWMHLLSIGFPLGSAIGGLVLNLYDELTVGHYCWFTGDDATLYALIVSALPGFVLLIIVVPVNNVLVYFHVHKTLLQQENLLERHLHRSGPPNTTSSADCDSHDGSHENDAPPLPGVTPHRTRLTATESVQSRETKFSNEQSRECDLEEERQRFRAKRQALRLRAVAFQSFLYVASFMACYLPSGVMRLISGTVGLGPDGEVDFYPLLVIQSILFPLQGLFNYWIYSRPSYLREALD